MNNSRALVVSLFFLPMAGCATILDFQDATDMPLTTTAPDPSEPRSLGPDDGGRSPDEASPPLASAPSDGDADRKPQSCACVVTAPQGWTGPLALYEGPPDIAPPGCDGPYGVTVHTGSRDPLALDATCGCTCESPTGVLCDAPKVTHYRDRSCTTACSGSTTLAAGSCIRSSPGWSNCNDGDVRAFAIGASTASGGSCAPNATVHIPPVEYAGVARLCGLPPDHGVEAGCGDGTVCAPPVTAPFATGNHCIARSGSWVCPAGYPAKHTFYDATKGSDTRSCSACTCGAPTGDCTVNLDMFTGNNNYCTNAPSTTAAPTTCLSSATATRFLAGAPQVAATCAPSGGAPVGSFVPSDPTTVCCER